MGIESKLYRKALADTLQTRDKSERPDTLRLAKGEYEYISAHGSHSLENYNAQQVCELEKIVATSGTLEELLQDLETTSLFIFNPQMGRDHPEHLVKRINLAVALACSSLIPEVGGLRLKAMALLEQEGVELTETVDPELYKEYLASRFPEHGFSDTEIAQIAEKVSPDLFGSLDTEIEDAIMEINALPQAISSFSCATHIDEVESDSAAVGAYSGYFSFSSDDPLLAEKIGSLAHRTDSFVVSVVSSPDKKIFVYFKNTIPDAWIKQNDRKTKEELFEESKKRLSLILGPEILNSSLQKYNEDEDNYLIEVVRLQKLFLHTNPKSATVAYGRNTVLLAPVVKYVPRELMWREYKDYYRSQEAQSQRLSFIKTLEETIKEYRKQTTTYT